MKAIWLSLTLLTTSFILSVAGVISLLYNTELGVGLLIIGILALILWLRVFLKEDSSESDDDWVVFAATDERMKGKGLHDLFPADIADVVQRQLATEPVNAFLIRKNEEGVWERHEVTTNEFDVDDADDE